MGQQSFIKIGKERETGLTYKGCQVVFEGKARLFRIKQLGLPNMGEPLGQDLEELQAYFSSDFCVEEIIRKLKESGRFSWESELALAVAADLERPLFDEAVVGRGLDELLLLNFGPIYSLRTRTNEGEGLKNRAAEITGLRDCITGFEQICMAGENVVRTASEKCKNTVLIRIIMLPSRLESNWSLKALDFGVKRKRDNLTTLPLQDIVSSIFDGSLKDRGLGVGRPNEYVVYLALPFNCKPASFRSSQDVIEYWRNRFIVEMIIVPRGLSADLRSDPC